MGDVFVRVDGRALELLGEAELVDLLYYLVSRAEFVFVFLRRSSYHVALVILELGFHPALLRLGRRALLFELARRAFEVDYPVARALRVGEDFFEFLALTAKVVDLAALFVFVVQIQPRFVEFFERALGVDALVAGKEDVFRRFAQRAVADLRAVELADIHGAVEDIFGHAEEDLARRAPFYDGRVRYRVVDSRVIAERRLAVAARGAYHFALYAEAPAVVVFERDGAARGRRVPAYQLHFVLRFRRETVEYELDEIAYRRLARFVPAADDVHAVGERDRHIVELAEAAYFDFFDYHLSASIN